MSRWWTSIEATSVIFCAHNCLSWWDRILGTCPVFFQTSSILPWLTPVTYAPFPLILSLWTSSLILIRYDHQLQIRTLGDAAARVHTHIRLQQQKRRLLLCSCACMHACVRVLTEHVNVMEPPLSHRRSLDHASALLHIKKKKKKGHSFHSTTIFPFPLCFWVDQSKIPVLDFCHALHIDQSRAFGGEKKKRHVLAPFCIDVCSLHIDNVKILETHPCDLITDRYSQIETITSEVDNKNHPPSCS